MERRLIVGSKGAREPLDKSICAPPPDRASRTVSNLVERESEAVLEVIGEGTLMRL